MTDEQYEDQYDKLFPDIEDIQDELAESLDERRGYQRKCSLEFVYSVEDAYKELWGVENKIPTTEAIEDRILEWLNHRLLMSVQEEHKYDKKFWEDEDYRLNVLSDAEDIYWHAVELDNIRRNIVDALTYLGYMYIDSDNLNVENTPQLNLFPEKSDFW